MITIKLTYTPIKVAKIITVAENATIADMVAACKAHWPAVVSRVEDETRAGNTYAMAFAEVYAPEINDELGGELSIALENTVKPKVKAVPAKPMPLAKVVIPASKATRPSKMRPATAASKAHKVSKVNSKVSKAEMVRELIRANPKKDVAALIVMAIDELEMTPGKAKTYVTENAVKVRG